MTSADARREGLHHAVQLQLAAANGIVYDVVGRAREFAEFLDPGAPARAEPPTPPESIEEHLARWGTRAEPWRNQSQTHTNAWTMLTARTYRVTLQRKDPGEPWVTVNEFASCIADAVASAEKRLPGHIAREVVDVS